VPDATVIDSLSYNEAMELAYFGAKVIHPQTMAPAVGGAIPIWIRNTFAPEKPGTLICAQPTSTLPVKGIASIERVALINLEGAGMIGVPGTAYRLFGALREEGISVILISQGSSEHSICCAIPREQAERARGLLQTAFARELAEGQIQDVDVTGELAILAVVGDGMAGMPGVAGKVFGALGNAQINVRAIAQGASERNISVVVDGKDATRALRAAHSSFYLSPHTLSCARIRCCSPTRRLHWAAGAKSSSGAPRRRTSSASPRTCMPISCRTQSSSTAARMRRSLPTTATGWRPGSTSSPRTRRPTAGRCPITSR
jgi:aspartokinase/homoserine dehydrogenase 1